MNQPEGMGSTRTSYDEINKNINCKRNTNSAIIAGFVIVNDRFYCSIQVTSNTYRLTRTVNKSFSIIPGRYNRITSLDHPGAIVKLIPNVVLSRF